MPPRRKSEAGEGKPSTEAVRGYARARGHFPKAKSEAGARLKSSHGSGLSLHTYLPFFLLSLFLNWIHSTRTTAPPVCGTAPGDYHFQSIVVPMWSTDPTWYTIMVRMYANASRPPASMNGIAQELSSRRMMASVARHGIDSRQKSMMQNP